MGSLPSRATDPFEVTLRHQLHDVLGEGHRVVKLDAFHQQRLIVQQVGVQAHLVGIAVRLGLLKEGMEDPQVRTVQQLLAAKGYELGEADGIMGEATVGAVRAFQENSGLLADGEVGGDTWSKLLKG